MRPFLLSRVLLFALTWNALSCHSRQLNKQNHPKGTSCVETIAFLNGGVKGEGRIHLPAAYDSNQLLPVIYLIDFTEQHFALATDEFERVVDGVEMVGDVDALVVSLANIPDIDAEPNNFQDHYRLFLNLVKKVDEQYPNNSSRTLIGKGSESGIVLMALFLEDRKTPVFENFVATDPSWLYASEIIRMIEQGDFPPDKPPKKLHFSFSTSNDRRLCNALIELIRKADYPWLQFRSKEYTKSNYENTYPVAFSEGLAFVFGPE